MVGFDMAKRARGGRLERVGRVLPPRAMAHFVGGLFPRTPPDGLPVVLGPFPDLTPPPLLPLPPPLPLPIAVLLTRRSFMVTKHEKTSTKSHESTFRANAHAVFFVMDFSAMEAGGGDRDHGHCGGR